MLLKPILPCPTGNLSALDLPVVSNIPVPIEPESKETRLMYLLFLNPVASFPCVDSLLQELPLSPLRASFVRGNHEFPVPREATSLWSTLEHSSDMIISPVLTLGLVGQDRRCHGGGSSLTSQLAPLCVGHWSGWEWGRRDRAEPDLRQVGRRTSNVSTTPCLDHSRLSLFRSVLANSF